MHVPRNRSNSTPKTRYVAGHEDDLVRSGYWPGSVFGGAINDIWGWRFAFLLLTPVTAISALEVELFVPECTRIEHDSSFNRLRRIDFPGAYLLVSILVLLLWSLNVEKDDGSPSYLAFIISMPIVAGMLVLFVWVEARYALEPIIPVTLLHVRTVAASDLARGFVDMGIYTLISYVPLYLQIREYSTGQVGLRLVPEACGTALGCLGSGMITRLTGGYGRLKIVVLLFLASGAVGFSTSTLATPIVLAEIIHQRTWVWGDTDRYIVGTTECRKPEGTSHRNCNALRLSHCWRDYRDYRA